MRGYALVVMAGLGIGIMASTASAVKQTMVAHIEFGNGAALSTIGDLKLSQKRVLTPGRYRLSTSGLAFHANGKKIAGSHLAGEIAIIGADQQVIDILATNYKEGQNIAVDGAMCRYAGGKETACSLTMQPSSSKGLPLLLGADLTVGQNNVPTAKPAQFDLVVTYN